MQSPTRDRAETHPSTEGSNDIVGTTGAQRTNLYEDNLEKTRSAKGATQHRRSVAGAADCNEWIRQVVAAAPRMTKAQRACLAELLRPVVREDAAAA